MAIFTFKSDKFFTKVHTEVNNLKEELERGDLEGAQGSLDSLGSRLGEIRDFLDYAEEAQRL